MPAMAQPIDGLFRWLKTAAVLAIWGAIVGGAAYPLLMSALGATNETVHTAAYFAGQGVVYGVVLFAGVPLLVAAWFLFLHMVSQVAAAARKRD